MHKKMIQWYLARSCIISGQDARTTRNFGIFFKLEVSYRFVICCINLLSVQLNKDCDRFSGENKNGYEKIACTIGLLFDFGNIRRVGIAHRIRVLVGIAQSDKGFGGHCPPYTT